MKSKDRVILIIVLALIGGLVTWLIVNGNKTNKNHYNWSESYWQRSDQPYGTEIVSKLLDGYFEGYHLEVEKNDIVARLKEESAAHRNYVFIGWEPYFTDSLFHALADFVYNGNDAFLAVKEIPDQLSASIFRTGSLANAADSAFYTTEFNDTIWYKKPVFNFDSSTYSYFRTPTITMNFAPDVFRRDSSWSFTYNSFEGPLNYHWEYFINDYVRGLYRFDSLGTIQSDNFINFIRVPYGKGFFYVHLDPVVFTNYFQVKKENIEYTSKVFSYFTPGDIIWDEASKTYQYGDEGFMFNNEQEGPLKFILSQQSLRWGWYTLLAGLLLFLLFRSKRRQKPIPVMEPNENKSLEFVETIGRMYFMSRNHQLLAQQKMKLFLHFISDRYQLPANEINDDFYSRLNMKSEIPVQQIKDIFNHYRVIENAKEASSNDLINLHQLIDSFYKSCK